MNLNSIKQYVFDNAVQLFIVIIIALIVVPFLKRIITCPFKLFKRNKNYIIIRKNLLRFTNDQLQKQINSKKYLPDSYIEINQIKESLRYFSHPLLFYNKFIDFINRSDFTFFNAVIYKEVKKRIVFKAIRKLRWPSLKSFKSKINKLTTTIDKESKILMDISKKSYDSLWLARRKMDEIIEKLNLLKSRVLIVLDDAGQGKTNLICDLTKEFLLKLKIPVVLFYGADFYGLSSKSMSSCVAECIIGRSDFNSLSQFITKECKKRKSNFILIIDALNESSDINFPNELSAFINTILRNEFIRIILTCRTQYYNLNFKLIESEAFAPDVTKIEGINSKLEENEKDNLFRKYLSSFNIVWTSFSIRVYEKLTDNFLLLRIFCEVHQGEKIGHILNVYMLDLFQEYYRQFRDRVNVDIPIQSIVHELVNHMVDFKSYKDIPMQIIIDKASINKNALLRLIDENIFFRRDITNTKGVLLDQEVISFTFDEIRDYLIADYLVNILLSKDDSKFLSFITEELSPEKPLFEGVSKYLFFFAKKEHKDRKLQSIIEKSKWYEDRYLDYVFETNDDDLTKRDIDKIQSEFLLSDDKAEFILEMLIYYRYDTQIYKNLNITILYPILIELSDKLRFNKFESHFKKKNSSVVYGKRENSIKLDHYFDFIEEVIKKGDTKNPSIDFLFFIAFIKNSDTSLKALHSLRSFYKKHPKIILEMLEKYRVCNNDYFKEKATLLMDLLKGAREIQ